MPKILINVEDYTGVAYTGDEIAIFVPGHLKLKSKENDGILSLDQNNCAYISASMSSKLTDIFAAITPDDDGNFDETELKLLAYISECLSLDYDVLYCYIEDLDENIPSSLKFLWDKNTYNIKYLTAGPVSLVKVIGNESNYTFTSTDLIALNELAQKRKDCIVLADLDYSILKGADDYQSLDVDKLATSLQKYFTPSILPEGQNSALFFPNVNFSTVLTEFNKNIDQTSFNMPSHLAYLAALAKCIRRDQDWLSVAGVTRGELSSLGFTPDLELSKYTLDEEIIVNENGAAYNGIVNVRGYGPTIWGDRTLLNLGSSVQALGYLSLKTLVCDIAKRAYQTAINCTYESNNDVTWINYRTNITELLDQMVASGVLDNYKIRKGVPKTYTTYNTIACIITLYANLPVENFEVYINLENAEITISEGGNE